MDYRHINTVGGRYGHGLFEQIISLENLFWAWKEFKRGKTSKIDIQRFAFNLEDNLFQLHYELAAKNYHHSKYTAFYITDPKLRHIHKACVRDRVLHHAIFRVLYPIFDNSFIHDSYSCRVDKGTHRAIRRLEQFLRKVNRNNIRKAFVLKCDIKKFFDSIDQETLLSIIERKIKDPDALWLIKLIVESFETKKGKGLPIGNVTSQLFANIYLNELDQFAKHTLKAKYYIRYCDDFTIVLDEVEKAKIFISKIEKFLEANIRLSLHKDKVIVRPYKQGVDFLGYVLLPHHRILRTKTKRRIMRKIVNDNNESLQSYFGILKHCHGYGLKQKLLKICNKKATRMGRVCVIEQIR